MGEGGGGEEADAGSSRVFTWQRAVPGTHHQRRSLGGESAAASPAHAQRQCCGLREWRNSPVDSLSLSLSAWQCYTYFATQFSVFSLSLFFFSPCSFYRVPKVAEVEEAGIY